MSHLWTSQKTGFQQSLQYMEGRRKGTIKSLRTPWEKFNDAGTGGIEWNTITIISGRPASGKTLIESQIVKEAFILNQGEDFRVLRFQFEMLSRTSAIREYSSLLGKSYKYLCSAEEEALTEDDLQKCYEYAKEQVKYPIDIVDTPITVVEFEATVHEYMYEHALKTEGNIKYENTLISIDHSVLLKKDKHEKNHIEMLYNLGEVLTKLKKKYPIAFIILSQLNRDINNPDRCEDGKYGNFVLESDIFGADALLQHADMVVAIDRPGKRRIKFYGPDRYIIPDNDTLVLHFLKCRNGDTRMSFFKAEFHRMMVSEMPPPPQQERKLKTS